MCTSWFDIYEIRYKLLEHGTDADQQDVVEFYTCALIET